MVVGAVDQAPLAISDYDVIETKVTRKSCSFFLQANFSLIRELTNCWKVLLYKCTFWLFINEKANMGYPRHILFCPNISNET